MQAILANVPFDNTYAGKQLANKKPSLPAVVDSIRFYSDQFAQSASLKSHVTGFAAIFADLFGAFSGIDTTLIFTTVIVVGLILIVVYRSPILWILPLFSAVMAESLAGAIIYVLAKHNIITLDGQSQGILSVLVIGAATDYALLLIARYREELHHFDSRFDAMKVAWRGVVEPIVASGSTVTLGLLVLLISMLKNTKGLGPVGAIGIVCAMFTILTLLPAILVIFGRWIFWPKIPRHDDVDEKLTGIWSKVARATQTAPQQPAQPAGPMLASSRSVPAPAPAPRTVASADAPSSFESRFAPAGNSTVGAMRSDPVSAYAPSSSGSGAALMGRGLY